MTLSQKAAIQSKEAESPMWTRDDHRRWAQTEFKLPKLPSKPTITRVLRDPLLHCATELPPHRKQFSSPRVPELDDALWHWVQAREKSGVCLSGGLITAKARTILTSLESEDVLKLSCGWLDRFKKRHGIRQFTLHGEAGSADTEAAEEAVPELLYLTDKYELSDIFNCDETAFNWNVRPPTTLATQRRSGKKNRKQRITVLFCSNADGSEKMGPFFIGTAKKPQCFLGNTPAQEGFVYHNNKRAWMTASLFQEWLRTTNEEMKTKGRKILLLIDNVSSHVAADVTLSNVAVHFLPPNTTSRLKPMDAGIIASTKVHYKAKVMQHAIRLDELGCDATDVDLRQGMLWMKEAWQEVTTATISNC